MEENINELIYLVGSVNQGYISLEDFIESSNELVHIIFSKDTEKYIKIHVIKKHCLPEDVVALTKEIKEFLDWTKDAFQDSYKAAKTNPDVFYYDSKCLELRNFYFLYIDLMFLLEITFNPKNYLKDEPKERHTELQTDRAVKYLAKAVEVGYIEQTETGYKSKFSTKALLAYFLELVFCRDDEGKDNGKAFPEEPLNNLFNEKRLGQTMRQNKNNKNGYGKPKGYKEVDDLFK